MIKGERKRAAFPCHEHPQILPAFKTDSDHMHFNIKEAHFNPALGTLSGVRRHCNLAPFGASLISGPASAWCLE